MTTAARSRHSAGTRITASEDRPAAQTSTASAPRPRDQPRTCSVVASPDSSRASTPVPAATPARVAGRVDPGHVAAGGHGQPRRELADQAKPQHHDLGARPHLGDPQPVQRDRGDRGERRVLRRHPVGHRRAQQPGTAWNSAWLALPAPPAATSWPGPHPGHRRARLQHDARRGVPQRQVLSQPAADRLPGRGQTLGAGLADHLPDQVGAGPGLGEQAGLGQRGDRPFGARGDHRRDRPDQDLGGVRDGPGHLEHLDRPAGQRLHDLLHLVPPIAVVPPRALSAYPRGRRLRIQVR